MATTPLAPSGDNYNGPDRRRQADARSQVAVLRFACALLLAVAGLSTLGSLSALDVRTQIADLSQRLEEHIHAHQAGICD